jgi:hypothetical protein
VPSVDWAAGVSGIVAALGGAASYLLARRSRLTKVEFFGTRIELLEPPKGEQPAPSYDELIDRLTRAEAAISTGPMPESLKTEVQELKEAFQARLERIEQRFPEEATLEKIASINDAILATKIEQVEKSLEELSNRMLSKWDVAAIVFAVIAAVGGVAGAIIAVANFVLK